MKYHRKNFFFFIYTLKHGWWFPLLYTNIYSFNKNDFMFTQRPIYFSSFFNLEFFFFFISHFSFSIFTQLTLLWWWYLVLLTVFISHSIVPIFILFCTCFFLFYLYSFIILWVVDSLLLFDLRVLFVVFLLLVSSFNHYPRDFLLSHVLSTVTRQFHTKKYSNTLIRRNSSSRTTICMLLLNAKNWNESNIF